MRDEWTRACPESSIRPESGRVNARSVSRLQHLVSTLDSKIDIEEKFCSKAPENLRRLGQGAQC